jgi:nucleoporin NUP42
MNEAQQTISASLQSVTATVKLAQRLHDARYPPGTAIGGPRPADFDENTIIAAAAASTP